MWYYIYSYVFLKYISCIFTVFYYIIYTYEPSGQVHWLQFYTFRTIKWFLAFYRIYAEYIYLYTCPCISGKPLMIVHHDSEKMPEDINEQLVDAFDIRLSDRVASIVEEWDEVWQKTKKMCFKILTMYLYVFQLRCCWFIIRVHTVISSFQNNDFLCRSSDIKYFARFLCQIAYSRRISNYLVLRSCKKPSFNKNWYFSTKSTLACTYFFNVGVFANLHVY